MQFNIGDKVVYPSQGVAQIQRVVQRKIGGLSGEFFVLQILSSNSTVLIPRGNIEQVGLRPLAGKSEMQKLFQVLKSDGTPDPDWKKRHKANLESMASCNLVSVGQVLKDLYSLSEKKTLGLRDQRMMEQARQFVVSELAAVKNLEEEEAAAVIAELLGPFEKEKS
jgi:CarD family transcriptional regulator